MSLGLNINRPIIARHGAAAKPKIGKTHMEAIFHIIEIIGVIGGIGAVAGGVALGLFKVFGERWINNRFDRALEDLKHEQTQELESLKYRISGLLDRVTRLNDREFEVLPEAWAKLLNAYNVAFVHTSSGREGTNIDAMDEPALETFLALSPLYEFQKDKVRQAKDRVKEYFELIYLHDKADARKAAQEFSRYMQSHGIFIRSKAKFKVIDDMVWEALRQHGLIREHRIMPKPGESGIDALEKKGRELLDELEAEIHGGLWATDLASAVKSVDTVKAG